MNKSTYCLDKFLQEEIGFLRKELDNKQNIVDNLINLLNGITTKRDETISPVKVCKLRILLKNTKTKRCKGLAQVIVKM